MPPWGMLDSHYAICAWEMTFPILIWHSGSCEASFVEDRKRRISVLAHGRVGSARRYESVIVTHVGERYSTTQTLIDSFDGRPKLLYRIVAPSRAVSLSTAKSTSVRRGTYTLQTPASFHDP